MQARQPPSATRCADTDAARGGGTGVDEELGTFGMRSACQRSFIGL